MYTDQSEQVWFLLLESEALPLVYLPLVYCFFVHIQGMRFVPLVVNTYGRADTNFVRLMLVLAARQAEVIINNTASPLPF